MNLLMCATAASLTSVLLAGSYSQLIPDITKEEYEI